MAGENSPRCYLEGGIRLCHYLTQQLVHLRLNSVIREKTYDRMPTAFNFFKFYLCIKF